MNANPQFLNATAHVDEGGTQPFAKSRKVYVEGTRPDIRVPMREVSLSDTPASMGAERNPPIFIYDTSGPYTDPNARIDIRDGLAPLRTQWIEARGDTERRTAIPNLPNSAGCYTAEDAVRTLRLARELLGGHDLVKLEVLGDQRSLFPNMPETIKAAETLVREGFKVMVYCSDDPIQAKHLEQIGCVAIMPLASLIGSGMGILNPWNLRLIVDSIEVPVIVYAGVGIASDAAIAMELGCEGVLMNTAIAAARDPVLMASAMRKAVEAGREAYLAGRMPRKLYAANSSSPQSGMIHVSA